jgi:hypothetical protein
MDKSMKNHQLLKIYSNKKNNKYNSFIRSIIKNKYKLKHNNVKVKVIKTTFELVSELYDYNNKIIYRTRDPNIESVFNKLKTSKIQKKSHPTRSHRLTNINMHSQYSNNATQNSVKQNSVKQHSVKQHSVKQHSVKQGGFQNHHLQKEVNQVDKYSNHAHSNRKAHYKLENEINDSMSQTVNKKMSVYVKNTNNINGGSMEKNRIVNNKMSIFVKPVVKDDAYKYDDDGNFIKGLSGIGYKNAHKAEQTIKQIEDLSSKGIITPAKQLAIILKMYYRAKNHKYQTEDMRGAIRVYKQWIKDKDHQTEQDN